MPRPLKARSVAAHALGACALACVLGCRDRAPAEGASAAASPPPSAGVGASDAGPPGATPGAAAPATPSAPSASAGPYNVLLVSIDSLRADMPWAGYPRPIAPRLTELHAKSVSYARSYSISSYTSMSLGGFVAGRYPSELPRSGYFFGKYRPDGHPTVAEVAKAAGVVTLAAHAHGYFKEAGLERGFDAWELVPDLKWNNTTDENVTSDKHEALAERLLARPELAEKRFFAWFHFLDPHDKYQGHEADGVPAYGKSLRDKYDAEVTYTDRYVGKLLDFVAQQPWASRTVVVVTADHGEAFGEKGQFVHGFEVWEHLVRVPLFFVVPGEKPRVIDTPRSAIDLGPTILALLGVEKDAAMRGESLVPELRGGPAKDRDVIVDLPATSDNDRRRALVRGTKKLLAQGTPEVRRLYDLAEDPREEHPITKGETFDTMVAAYKEASATIPEVVPFGCGAGCLNGAYRTKK